MTTSPSRNPTPRPALRPRGGPDDGVEVARPTTGDPAVGGPPSASTPNTLGKRKRPTPAKSAKSAKSKKNKKSSKDSRPRKGDREVELTITLTKADRKALSQAAADRDTSPEQLASFVLTAWLD